MSTSWPPRWTKQEDPSPTEAELSQAFAEKYGDQGSESMPTVPPYKGPIVGFSGKRSDAVNSPDHYTEGGIEAIDVIEAKRLGYHLGNAVKYILRCQYKGDRKTDVKKAIWYLERYLKTIETEQ